MMAAPALASAVLLLVLVLANHHEQATLVAAAAATVDVSRATGMHMDASEPALFVGDSTALYKFHPQNLSVSVSRVVADPSNCVRFDASSFSGSGAEDDGFCVKEDQSCISAECVAGTCSLMYFTSTCSGNEYYLMGENQATGDLLVCSALTQCQTVSKTTLQDLFRADTDVEAAPQGWFCGAPFEKDVAGFFTSELETGTEQFCPVWRYGPLNPSSIKVVCVCVCMRVCVCVCVYACLCACVCVRACV